MEVGVEKGFRGLKVWQEGRRLAVLVYQATRSFPATESYGLTAQMRRAAVSVPANLAEGWGRSTPKELHRFASIARGSVFELMTHLEIARDLGFLAKSEAQELMESYEGLAIGIYRLIQLNSLAVREFQTGYGEGSEIQDEFDCPMSGPASVSRHLSTS